MGFRRTSSGGVTGTVGAFNFIRRVSFPTTSEVISIFCAFVALSTLISLPSTRLSLSSIVWTTIFLLILPVMIGEFLNAGAVLRGDPVLGFRRLMGLELVSWWTLLLTLPLSTLLEPLLRSRWLWTDGLLLSLALSLPVRSLGIFAISSLPSWRKALGAAMVPVLMVSALSYTVAFIEFPSEAVVVAGLVVVVTGLVLSLIGVSWFVQGVDKAGSPSIGASPMELFRAFLQHWLKKEPKPLEDRLADLGSFGEVETSILAFSNSRKSPKGCVVVSNFHPGPYRDLGSGGLPSSLKLSIESSVGGVALVPHGISNHEFNIITHKDIANLLTQASSHYPADIVSTKASQFVREEFEGAKASAQAFGNLVLLTLTLAPLDMEDIPVEVLNMIQATASEKGLVALSIDAHNSLSGQTSITPDQARKLAQAAVKALTTVSKLPQHSFRVGMATDPLREFSLEEGLGPGGLSLLLVEAGSQLAAYLTIDGNNLQSGFRNLILDELKSEGIDDAEVTTTDTHLVTGLVRSPLGYHPVGEGIDRQLLAEKIRETVRRALTNTEEAATGFSHFRLNLRVLGSEAFSSITSFIGKTGESLGRFFLRLQLAVFLSSLAILAVL